MTDAVENQYIPKKLNCSNEELLVNDNLIIVYYPDYKLVHYIWKRRTIGEEYRNAFLKGLELTKNLETTYFISDIRNQGIVSPDDRKWFQENALQAGIEAGLMKAAIIFDGNAFKKYYINIILKLFVNTGRPMKVFQDLESARIWLLEIKTPIN